MTPTACEPDSVDFLARTATRALLTSGLQAQLALQNPSWESVASWSASLSTIVAVPREVDASTSEMAAAVAVEVLGAMKNLNMPASQSLVALAIDYILTAQQQSIQAAHSSSSQHDTQRNSTSENLVSLLGQVVSSTMVAGQLPDNITQTNYRIASIVFPPSGDIPVSRSHASPLFVPFSKLEAALGIIPSSVQIAALTSSASVGVNLVSSAAGNAPTLNATSRYSSNPLFVQYDRRICDGENGSSAMKTFIFSLQHFSPQNSVSANGSKSEFELRQYVRCKTGSVTSSQFQCPPVGDNQTVPCDGTHEYAIAVTCARAITTPQCTPLKSTTGQNMFNFHCSMLNATESFTICECKMDCRTPSPLSSHSRHLQESTSIREGLQEYGVMGVASLLLGSVSGLELTLASAKQFNSVQALKATLLISLTFVVLWSSLFGFKAIIDIAQKKLSSEVPGQQSKKAMSRVAPQLDGLHDENMDGIVSAYIRACVLPKSIASRGSWPSRMLETMLTMHPLLKCFHGRDCDDDDFKRTMTLLQYLTQQSYAFFMMAFLYNIQFPMDDGSCSTLTTQAACLYRRSAFNPRTTKCLWALLPMNRTRAHNFSDFTAGTGSAYLTMTNISIERSKEDIFVCEWSSPTYDVYTYILLTIFVMVMSLPVGVFLDYVFTSVVFAPTATDLKPVAGVRAQSGSTTGMRDDASGSKTGVRAAGVSKGSSARRSVRMLDSTDLQSIHEEVRRKTVFTSIVAIPESIKRARLLAAVKMHNKKAIILLTDRLRTQARALSQVPRTIDRLESDLIQLRDSLATAADRMSLEVAWGLRGDVLTEDSKARYKELIDAAEKRATKLLEDVDGLASVIAGTKLLRQFFGECLGSDLAKTAILENQFEFSEVQSTRIVSWGMKCFAIAGVLVVNLCCMYGCLIYGYTKGHAWQTQWHSSATFALVTQILFYDATTVFVLHFLIPELIRRDAWEAETKIEQLISGVCVSHSADGISQSNINCANMAAYFSPAMRVAERRSELMESALVLMYATQKTGPPESVVSTGQARSTHETIHVTSARAFFVSSLAVCSVHLNIIWQSFAASPTYIQVPLLFLSQSLTLTALMSMGAWVTHSIRNICILTAVFVAAVLVYICWFYPQELQHLIFPIKKGVRAEPVEEHNSDPIPKDVWKGTHLLQPWSLPSQVASALSDQFSSLRRRPFDFSQFIIFARNDVNAILLRRCSVHCCQIFILGVSDIQLNPIFIFIAALVYGLNFRLLVYGVFYFCTSAVVEFDAI